MPGSSRPALREQSRPAAQEAHATTAYQAAMLPAWAMAEAKEAAAPEDAAIAWASAGGWGG